MVPEPNTATCLSLQHSREQLAAFPVIQGVEGVTAYRFRMRGIHLGHGQVPVVKILLGHHYNTSGNNFPNHTGCGGV